MKKRYIVFGANGALGSAIVRYLYGSEDITAVVHNGYQNIPSSVKTIKSDCLNKNNVISLCKEHDIIFHCINVPYHKWQKQIPVITENILFGAIENKATLVFPGNVYGYGPFITSPFNENHPRNANSKKGILRNSLEAMLEDAHKRGNIILRIPRFPDYYGPGVVNKLMEPLFSSALIGKKALWLGSLNASHSLIYIDDAAKASVLIANEGRDVCYHVSGDPLTGKEFISTVFQCAQTKENIAVLRKNFFKFVGLFDKEAKELIELMYEFEEPMIMNDSKFRSHFPDFEYTQHKTGIEKTLAWFRK